MRNQTKPDFFTGRFQMPPRPTPSIQPEPTGSWTAPRAIGFDRIALGSGLCAKPTHKVHDEGDQQDETDATASNGRAAEIETAAAEEKHENENK